MTLRWSALVPVFASTVVVALSIILLASGTTPATANDDFWLSADVPINDVDDQQVNVSRIGQDLIRITPTNISSAALAFRESSDDSSDSAQQNALECLLGNLTACLQPPPLPTPVFPTPATSGGSPTTSEAASAVSSTAIVLDLPPFQPTSDIFNLYVTKICQGNFTDEQNSDSNFVTTGCFPYSDKTNGLGQIVNVTNAIPSSLVIGNTAKISVPALAGVQKAISSVMSSVASVSKVIFALVVIRTIAGTLALAGSALLFVDIRRFVVFTMLTFATLANISLLLTAGITTGVVVLQAESISGLAEALTVEVLYGTNFLIVEWVTAAFAILGSAYWLVLWFVEFRTWTYSRRSRSDRQIGNWSGTWSELVQDLRGDYYKL